MLRGKAPPLLDGTRTLCSTLLVANYLPVPLFVLCFLLPYAFYGVVPAIEQLEYLNKLLNFIEALLALAKPLGPDPTYD
jgi:hypothetical protein